MNTISNQLRARHADPPALPSNLIQTLEEQARVQCETIVALAGVATSFTEADFLADRADSYSRLNVIMRAMRLSRLEWFRLLGNQWSGCDNIWSGGTDLKRMIRTASRAELNAMMDEAEIEALAQLPDNITVYRGCYWLNRYGLSWSLDRATAKRFPTLMRYRRYGEQPVLLTGIVPRIRAVLKLDRAEHEIISSRAKIVSTEPLDAVMP